MADRPQTFILDSGAFSVWNKGAEVDLDEYIRFCSSWPMCPYYVALDSIPGKPNDPRSLTADSIQYACKLSWDNYQHMLKTLPIEKVIPVFHMGDSWDWLEKYMDFGTPYIGISPANDRTTTQKLKWLADVKKRIFDSEGKPLIKTHGFAVTSFRLMKAMQWHSVDSASWLKQAAYGTTYIPHKRFGEFVYSESPMLVNFSPRSPTNDNFGKHITNLSPTIRGYVDEYLESINAKIGEFEIVETQKGHKRVPREEIWFDKKKDKVIRNVEWGLSTCRDRRLRVNVIYLTRANEVLPVDHIYFAAGESSVHDEVEKRLGRRLMSYHALHDIPETAQGMVSFKMWMDRFA